jgi:uncharacterized protein (DUF983 family)
MLLLHWHKTFFSMNYLASLFKSKCPRCRQGDLFCTKSAYKKGFMKMHSNCTECNQRTELEQGFYYGSAYVSYALTVALSVATFVAWYVLIGMGLDDNRVFWWIGFNALFLIVLQPWLMRLSRTVWLSFFVKYNRSWNEEMVKADL